MKRSIIAFISIAAMTLTGGCSGIHNIKSTGVPIVDLAKLEKDPAKHGFGLEQSGKPRFPHKGLIVRVPKGTTVPLRLALDVSVVALEQGKNLIRFNRDVLIYISRGSLKISPDGRRWARIHDVKAMKELFGMKGRGTIGFGFGISKEKGAGFHLALTQPGG